MEAIPVPVRRRIIELYDQAETTEEIAERTGYCVAAVRRVRQRFVERGTLEPMTHRCGRKGKLTEQLRNRLRGLLEQLRDAMKADISIATVDRWARRLGFTFKKSRSMPPSRIGRT